MFVNLSVPNNLVELVKRLSQIAEAEPLVADHIAPIVSDAFEFAVSSGRVSDPDVWVRAFKAAVIRVETAKADDTWLAMAPVRGPLEPT